MFSGPGGKKNRQKERRLMKGYNLTNSVSTPVPSNGGHSQTNTNPEKSNHVTINNTATTVPSNKTYTETKIEINSPKKGNNDYLLTKGRNSDI